jgi:hypothetical protein
VFGARGVPDAGPAALQGRVPREVLYRRRDRPVRRPLRRRRSRPGTPSPRFFGGRVGRSGRAGQGGCRGGAIPRGPRFRAGGDAGRVPSR